MGGPDPGRRSLGDLALGYYQAAPPGLRNGEPVVAADAGRPPRLFSLVLGPAWLHSVSADTMMRNIIIMVFVMGLFSKLLGGEKSDDNSKDFPPVPEWQPDIQVPLDKIIERFRYYTDHKKDFVVLKHGTCVLVSDGLTEEQARKEALETVSKIFNYHPDMNPKSMDDGNILIFYNQPAYTVVLEQITKQHMDAIRKNHLKALARAEVLMTPAGPNKFDEFGMKALFGRCYFFMDAKKPEVFSVVRKAACEPGGAANRSQPTGSATNRTSSAAGSGR